PRQVIERKLPAAGFFERFADVQPIESRTQALELIEALKAHLYDLSVIVLGEDDPSLDPVHPVYIVGLNRKGNLVGLKSQVVWT
ncbi:MAG: nuclease A inhibitor family protein, partial [Bacteroidota bacterium]